MFRLMSDITSELFLWALQNISVNSIEVNIEIEDLCGLRTEGWSLLSDE
jgi:hypothetical protein